MSKSTRFYLGWQNDFPVDVKQGGLRVTSVKGQPKFLFKDELLGR
jgi:hypothetical protein